MSDNKKSTYSKLRLTWDLFNFSFSDVKTRLQIFSLLIYKHSLKRKEVDLQAAINVSLFFVNVKKISNVRL